MKPRIVKGTGLEVTYRRGHAVAAYDDLPRRPEERSDRTRRIEPGFVIDFARDGRAIGIEITAPTRLSPDAAVRLLLDAQRTARTKLLVIGGGVTLAGLMLRLSLLSVAMLLLRTGR